MSDNFEAKYNQNRGWQIFKKNGEYVATIDGPYAEEFAKTAAAALSTLKPEGEQISGEHRPPFEFDRYINGVLMAEGVTIEQQSNLVDAMRVAARIASKGPNREAPVLVYRAPPEQISGDGSGGEKLIVRLNTLLAEFDAEVEDHLNEASERADLWDDIDVPVSWIREVVAVITARSTKIQELVGEIEQLRADLAAMTTAANIMSKQLSEAYEKINAYLKVEVPYAYCCNGSINACDCVNKNHGTALVDDNSASLYREQISGEAVERGAHMVDPTGAFGLSWQECLERSRAILEAAIGGRHE